MSNNPANVEIHNPPNRLKAKLGNMSSVFDARAVARAEAALVTLSDNFGDWLDEEVVKLSRAHQAIKMAQPDDAQLSQFYRCAHDLKGLGTTYGYPLISEFASSLCRLLDSPEARARAPKEVLDAHVSAINAALKQRITSSDDAIGSALLKELQAHVSRFEDVA